MLLIINKIYKKNTYKNIPNMLLIINIIFKQKKIRKRNKIIY